MTVPPVTTGRIARDVSLFALIICVLLTYVLVCGITVAALWVWFG